jgi:hypothetical protein
MAPDAGVADIGLDAKESRYSYQFGMPKHPRLCGDVSLWLDCVNCGEEVAAARGTE